MPTYDRLRFLFRTVVATTIASQAAACSNTSPFERSNFEVDTCEEYTFGVSGLALAEPVDWIAVRNFLSFDTAVIASDNTPQGTKCATATDQAACVTAVDTLPRTPGFTGRGPYFAGVNQIVYTRGDTVGAAGDLQSLRALLGPIDTETEAVLVAALGTGYYLACPGPNVRKVEGGYEVLLGSGQACGEGTHRDEHIVFVRTDGTFETVSTRIVERGDPNCVIGRTTEGVRVRKVDASTVGEHLARMAALEASAVVAFERLAAELEAFGAPDELVARARAARDDEARHVRMVSTEARRFGGLIEPVEVPALPLRALYDVAIENAREGMVRETYGALAGTYHARAAKDPSIARMFARIADDETRHAALSIDVGRFFETRLDERERAELDAVREDAVRSLADDVAVHFAPEVHDVLGWPDAVTARRLVTEAFPRAWS